MLGEHPFSPAAPVSRLDVELTGRAVLCGAEVDLCAIGAPQRIPLKAQVKRKLLFHLRAQVIQKQVAANCVDGHSTTVGGQSWRAVRAWLHREGFLPAVAVHPDEHLLLTNAYALGDIDQRTVVGHGVIRIACAGHANPLHDRNRATVDLKAIGIERHRPQRPVAPEDEVPAGDVLWGNAGQKDSVFASVEVVHRYLRGIGTAGPDIEQYASTVRQKPGAMVMEIPGSPS